MRRGRSRCGASTHRRFGCELIQRADGYFYLLPSGDRLGRRQLTVGEMLVGQTLALMYLDPATLQHGGMVQRETLLQRLSGLLGTEALVRTLNPRRRKFDERIAAETVRTKRTRQKGRSPGGSRGGGQRCRGLAPASSTGSAGGRRSRATPRRAVFGRGRYSDRRGSTQGARRSSKPGQGNAASLPGG
nr:chromosome partition protein MukE [Halochromatium glycolicum]